MLRLIVVLLVVVIGLSLAMTRLLPEHATAPTSVATSKITSPVLDLPPVDQCPSLSLRERTELTKRLHHLGERLHVEIPEGTSDEALTSALTAIDQKMAVPKSRQAAGPLRNYGPLQRQLRVLLWKHGVAAYNARGLNTVELLERLEERLDRKQKTQQDEP